MTVVVSEALGVNRWVEMSSNQEQLANLLYLVGYRHEFHPILVEANYVMSTSKLLDLLIDEIDECAIEYKKWRQHNDEAHQETKISKLAMLEFIDVNVFLKMLIERLLPNFSIEDINLRVNGQFGGDFKSLKEQALSLADGNVERNFTSFVIEELSLLKHVNVELQANLYAELVNAKLADNKESLFYQKEPGMSEADVLAKYEHVTAALRTLRNFLRKATGQEVTLQSWMTKPFSDLILNWRNSKMATAQLNQEIIQFQHQIKDEVYWMLTAKKGQKSPLPEWRSPVVGQFNNYNDLELKMLLAGAKLIDVKPEAKGKALQNRSSNATLGQTIFWV